MALDSPPTDPAANIAALAQRIATATRGWPTQRPSLHVLDLAVAEMDALVRATREMRAERHRTAGGG